MPELRYYEVIEIRKIKVSAVDHAQATLLAKRVFEGTKRPEDQLYIQEYPKVIEVHIKETNAA